MLRLKLSTFPYETEKRVYNFKVLTIMSDLFVIELHLDIMYWFTTQSIDSRNAEFEDYLDKLLQDLELEEDKEPVKATVKKAVKKPSVKKAVKKTAKKK